MNNKIEWNKYVDHIFCLQYLSNNRLNEISNTLKSINVNIITTSGNPNNIDVILFISICSPLFLL